MHDRQANLKFNDCWISMDDRLATRPLVGPQAKFDDGWTRAGQRAKFRSVDRRCARGLESIEWSMLCCPALAELGN